MYIIIETDLLDCFIIGDSIKVKFVVKSYGLENAQ